MATVPGMPEPDERYALVLDQVTRALSQQVTAIDGLRSRAGTVVAAASLVSSFLGAATLRMPDLSGAALLFSGLALAALVTVVVATVVILLPYRWRTGFNGHTALVEYVEADAPADLDEMRRSLAYYMQDDITANRGKLDRLYVAFQVAVIAIGLEVVFWLAALLLS
jgi:hypothetical protein